MIKRTFEVAYSRGYHPVSIGDKVNLHGIDWIIGEPQSSTYSPSGLGGTLCFPCKPVGEVPAMLEQYIEDDGSVVFCGDSIAAQMARVAAGLAPL